ncbi:MAG: hypothetical protein ACPL7K_00355, partial [Armatimonadota bacterium]
KVRRKASSPTFRRELVPLIKRAADIIRMRGGLCTKEELVELLLVRGPQGEMLRYATPFLEFLSGLPEWTEAGLVAEQFSTVDADELIRRLSDCLVRVARENADEYLGPELWSISVDALRRCLADARSVAEGTENEARLSITVVEEALKPLAHAVRRHGSRVYSYELWQLRFGKRIFLVEGILKLSGRAMHFTEVCQEAKRLRPGDGSITERSVAGWLERSEDILLWDRGTFVHRTNVNIPYDLLERVEDWVDRRLDEGIPFYSVAGAFRGFESECVSRGIPTQTALYTCLRQANDPRFSYPRYPYICPRHVERVPVAQVLEQYIDEANGSATYKDLHQFAVESLGLKKYQLDLALSSLSRVVVTDDGRYVHADDCQVDADALRDVAAFLQRALASSDHVSIAKAYRARIVSCKRMGIVGPRMLYDVMRVFGGSEFQYPRYPQVRLSTASDQSERSGIINSVVSFLAERTGPCTLAELEAHFVDHLGYDRGSVYAAVNRSQVLRYARGSVIHMDAIGWDAVKQQQLEGVAQSLLEQRRRAGACYACVTELVEDRWSKLPQLNNQVSWTELLAAALLESGGRFRVLGNGRNAYVSVPDEHGIETLQDLVAQILEHEYGGAAQKSELEERLSRHRIIRKALTQAMLGEEDKVKIVGNTVMLSELVRNA